MKHPWFAHGLCRLRVLQAWFFKRSRGFVWVDWREDNCTKRNVQTTRATLQLGFISSIDRAVIHRLVFATRDELSKHLNQPVSSLVT